MSKHWIDSVRDHGRLCDRLGLTIVVCVVWLRLGYWYAMPRSISIFLSRAQSGQNQSGSNQSKGDRHAHVKQGRRNSGTITDYDRSHDETDFFFI